MGHLARMQTLPYYCTIWIEYFPSLLCFGLLHLEVAAVVCMHIFCLSVTVLFLMYLLFKCRRILRRMPWIFLIYRPLERTGSVTVLFTPKSASVLMISFDVLMRRLFANSASCFKRSSKTIFSIKQKLLVLPKKVATTPSRVILARGRDFFW